MMMRETRKMLRLSFRTMMLLWLSLSGRKYSMTENGKIRVESKKVMKARGVQSPDEGRLCSAYLYASEETEVEEKERGIISNGTRKQESGKGEGNHNQ